MANFNPYVDKTDIDFWRELCQKEGTLRHYKKGDFFLRAGEIPKEFGFIESGYFKYSVVDSAGEEHITGFALRNNLAGDYYSSIHDARALIDLKAAKRSSVWVINTDLVKHMFDINPNIRLSLSEELFRTAHQRYLNLYRQTPKERYVELLNRCPDILQHVTLKELASFLQITPTHLSRIRKEILKKLVL